MATPSPIYCAALTNIIAMFLAMSFHLAMFFFIYNTVGNKNIEKTMEILSFSFKTYSLFCSIYRHFNIGGKISSIKGYGSGIVNKVIGIGQNTVDGVKNMSWSFSKKSTSTNPDHKMIRKKRVETTEKRKVRKRKVGPQSKRSMAGLVKEESIKESKASTSTDKNQRKTTKKSTNESKSTHMKQSSSSFKKSISMKSKKSLKASRKGKTSLKASKKGKTSRKASRKGKRSQKASRKSKKASMKGKKSNKTSKRGRKSIKPGKNTKGSENSATDKANQKTAECIYEKCVLIGHTKDEFVDCAGKCKDENIEKCD